MTLFGILPYKQPIYYLVIIILVIKLSERRLELFTTMLLFLPLYVVAQLILSIYVRPNLFDSKHLL